LKKEKVAIKWQAKRKQEQKHNSKALDGSNQSLKNPLTSETELMSQEDLMTLALIKKAREGDVAAYKALMDSGYGSPVQQIEQTNVEQPFFPDVDTDYGD
jgi:hypothetical protein